MAVSTSRRIRSDPRRWMKTDLSPWSLWHLWCLHQIGCLDCLTARALRTIHSPKGPSTWLTVAVILGLDDIHR